MNRMMHRKSLRVWSLALAAFAASLTQPWSLLAQAPEPAKIKYA